MLTKIFQSTTVKVLLPLILVLLFIYILFFEFILQANPVLPKPTILIDSIPALFKEYDFLSSFLFSFTAIYSVMIISYFSIRLGANWMFKMLRYFPGMKELFGVNKFFIPVFLIFLFELWFGNSIWGEYLFVLILTMGIFKASIAYELDKVNEEYLIAARSIGLPENEIGKKVIWKSMQPKVYDSLLKFHIPIWSYIIIYEFICKTGGVGNIFYMSLRYNDLSLTIVLFIFLILTFLIMENILKNIKKKYFFWEA
jgi:ABC-type nitrate/sulfonate/bicarbonate transport system permease component